MSNSDDKIEVESITSPHHKQRVNRAKYIAMREALLPVLPSAPPGMTVADAKKALLVNLSQTLFPGGEKAGWWLKAVQLDLEAKGVIARGAVKPVRLYRCREKTH